MKISERARQLPYSPIRKLASVADAAKARGVHVIHLNIGQPDIPTPATFYDAIRRYDNPVLAYGPSNGLPEYREALARYYARYRIDVESREIFVTTAGSEALMFAMLAVSDPGDNMLVMEPFYTNYNGFGAMMGIEIIGVPTRAEDGFQIPAMEEFEKRMTARTRAIMICNPNNPTGAVYSREALERLSAFAIQHGLFVISDEVYREFTYDGTRQVSVMHLDGLEDRAILVDSVSKRYSACGARIGCLVTKHAGVLDAVMRMGQARLCPPTLEQIGAMASIDMPDTSMKAIIDEYCDRRDRLLDGLNRIDGVFCEKPMGAFYLMVTLPVTDSDAFARFMLEDFQYKGNTVMVAPGAGFYATPGLGLNQVRMAYVLKKEELEAAVDVMAAGLAAFRDRQS
ncbi:pyridoxal phosphate-dependent aminotransferase [bacterium]|nr:pyridoxal phosphate-dependent aminotransferase [candidate division CSSED10-310 bacterium]